MPISLLLAVLIRVSMYIIAVSRRVCFLKNIVSMNVSVSGHVLCLQEFWCLSLLYAVMSSAPACSPNFCNTEDSHIDGKLSVECHDDVEDHTAVPNIVNGCASGNDDCGKFADSDSDVDCEGNVDVSPLHGLVTECQRSGSVALDLSRQGLHSLCHKLLKLSHLQVVC